MVADEPYPILCNNVRKEFGSVTAVADLDLQVQSGTVLGFVGSNGAGKSTTVRMLMGLLRPTSGTVLIFGQDPLTNWSVRRRVGYVPGELRLPERQTVSQLLAGWAAVRGSVEQEFLNELLDRFSLDVSRRVEQLSTGNRRKVALVGALMSRPDLLVLDEPTSGLDPLAQKEFVDLLNREKSRGATAFLSSHALGEVEQLADRTVIIRAGEVVADAPTAELRLAAVQRFEVRFAAEAPDLQKVRALPGTVTVTAPRDAALQIEWLGPPGPLLAELAALHPVSITAPEPDLETAFLELYTDVSNER